MPEEVDFIEREEGAREGLCTRCGSDAVWRQTNGAIEVVCPDCGTFQISREEFDRAESEIPEPEERRE